MSRDMPATHTSSSLASASSGRGQTTTAVSITPGVSGFLVRVPWVTFEARRLASFPLDFSVILNQTSNQTQPRIWRAPV